MGWHDIGFNAPQPWSSLRVLAFPAVYIVLFVVVAVLVGLPPPSVIFLLAINTLAVGFSEEIAFRGVLFRALHSRLRLWPAIWITSIAFGSVHVINGFTTGDFINASVQALTAFMSGIFFMALMLRTRSIVPSMLFHALWDFLLTTIGAANPSQAAPDTETHWWVLLVPPLFILPNFIYGLWLLRKVNDTEPAQ
jgi:membrane protease YdiL (CAAX protease family)